MGNYSGCLCGAGLLVILYLLFASQSSDQRKAELAALQKLEHEALLRATSRRKSSDQPISTTASNSLKNSIVRKGTDLTCAEAKRRVQTDVWPDPNEGKIYARETITTPHFRISLHEQTYDPVRWRIMEEGKYYEDEVHQRFVDILEHTEPSFVLDVGANIGYYTLLSASLGHNVIAFEPNPANVLRLCDSLRLNDFSNGTPEIHIFQNAVSNVHGEEMMLHSPKNPGQAFLKPMEGQDEETNDHKAKTTVISLDKLAEEQGWFDNADFHIKLLKVDVEGKEPQVFLGAPKLLKSGLVEHILTEGRRFGRTNIQDSFVVLFEAGYTIKEPRIPIDSQLSSAREKAKAVCDWWLNKLGSNSQMVRDMWWVPANELD